MAGQSDLDPLNQSNSSQEKHSCRPLMGRIRTQYRDNDTVSHLLNSFRPLMTLPRQMCRNVLAASAPRLTTLLYIASQSNTSLARLLLPGCLVPPKREGSAQIAVCRHPLWPLHHPQHEALVPQIHSCSSSMSASISRLNTDSKMKSTAESTSREVRLLLERLSAVMLECTACTVSRNTA